MGRQVLFTDDLTGEVGDDITTDFKFSVGVDRYVIDVSAASEQLLREALAPFVAKGRLVMAGRPSNLPITPPSNGNGTNGHQNGHNATESVPAEPATIKAWWVNLNARQLSDMDLPSPPPSGKGTIPKKVREAFSAANP